MRLVTEEGLHRMISLKSNPFQALALSALILTGCERTSPSDKFASAEPPKPEAKTNNLPWPKNDPLLENDMAKVYAHLTIAEEALRTSVDPTTIKKLTDAIPAVHRAEATKQLQRLMVKTASEHLEQAITLWTNYPSAIAQHKDTIILSGVVEQLRLKQDTGMSTDEAIPLARKCQDSAMLLQKEFGDEPGRHP